MDLDPPISEQPDDEPPRLDEVEGTNQGGFLDSPFSNAALKRRALAGAGATVLTQALKFVLKFGSALVLGRLLGPAAFGLVAMVSPILGFVSTLNDLGFTQAIIQRRDITNAQISNLFWIGTALGTGLGLLVVAISPLVGLIYHEPKTVPITIVLGLLMALGTLAMVPNALLSRHLRFTSQSVIDIGTQILNVVVTVGTALAGWSYWSLIAGQGAATIAGGAASWAVVGWRPIRPQRRTGIRSILAFGTNLTGVNLATYVSMTADTMIVGIFGGKVQLGLYNRSYTLVVQPLGQLMAPVGRVALPLLSRIDDAARYRTAFLAMLRLTVMLTAPAMLWCTTFPREVIALALGPKWVEAGPIFGWICFGGIFAPVFGAMGWLFTSQGRAAEQMRLSVITAVVSVASFAIGIRWGALGVSAASALSFIAIQTPLSIQWAARRGAVGARDLVTTLLVLAIAGAIDGGALVAIRGSGHAVPLLATAAISYALFGLLVLVLPGGRSFFRTLVGLVASYRHRHG